MPVLPDAAESRLERMIQFVCPNGHPVKVDVKHAGRTGKCPACGARVQIPEPPRTPQREVTESAVLDMLGPTASSEPADLPVHQEAPKPAGVAGQSTSSSSMMGGSALFKQPTKTCPTCKKKVSTRYQICPHCRTYMPISDLGEVRSTATTSCHSCGAPSFPGSSVCGNCGEHLR